jgi:hypothetical protein
MWGSKQNSIPGTSVRANGFAIYMSIDFYCFLIVKTNSAGHHRLALWSENELLV